MWSRPTATESSMCAAKRLWLHSSKPLWSATQAMCRSPCSRHRARTGTNTSPQKCAQPISRCPMLRSTRCARKVSRLRACCRRPASSEVQATRAYSCVRMSVCRRDAVTRGARRTAPNMLSPREPCSLSGRAAWIGARSSANSHQERRRRPLRCAPLRVRTDFPRA